MKKAIRRIVAVPYNRDRVAWWLRSPGNNDNNAACVNGGSGNVNDNGNNVNKEFGVRPALPGCPKCMEGSMRQCIRAKESGSFSQSDLWKNTCCRRLWTRMLSRR